MEINKIEELIKEWYNMNRWYSTKKQPLEFSNQLDQFMYINTYSSFREWFNDVILKEEEFDYGDMVLDGDKILNDPEEFEKYCFAEGESKEFGDISFYNMDTPIIVASSKDTQMTTTYFENIESIKNEEDFIAFLDSVLLDFGEVTHSSGLKPEYEVISVKTDWE